MQWWIWVLIVIAVLLVLAVAAFGRDVSRYLRMHRM
jgi:hypothetical protein